MALPTINDYFGPGSAVVTDITNYTTVPVSAQNPALVIPMSALASTGLSDVLSMSEADPVACAILKLIHKFSKSDVDENTMIEISDPTLNLATRAGKVMETMDYRLSMFKLRSQVLDFDPDNLSPRFVP